MQVSIVITCLLVATCSGRRLNDDEKVLVDAPPASHDRSGPKPPLDSSRQKRATPACGVQTLLTSTQKAESVNVHNLYRGQEPSADEMQLTWDENLAAVATAWAQQCKWQHGMLQDCSGNGIGQNLYMSWSSSGIPPVNMTKSITSWNNERQFWNFTSGACQAGKVCGHWTQLVWATSTAVGCGYANCPVVTNTDGSTVSNAIIVACDYSPPGNYIGDPIYTPGTACSKCSSVTRLQSTNRGYHCVSNLCVPCDPAVDSTCQCGPAETCLNGGTWSNTDCSCHCVAGFFGANCGTACVDVQPVNYCDSWNVAGYCDPNSDYYGYMYDNCAATCKVC